MANKVVCVCVCVNIPKYSLVVTICNSALCHRVSLGCSISTKFDDALTDVISLLLCDSLQHASLQHSTNNKKSYSMLILFRSLLVASYRSRVV